MNNPYRELFYGIDTKVPTAKGACAEINFDNGASTPPLKSVMEVVNDNCLWYGSLHSDNGFKSKLCTKLYEESKETVANFVNANYPEQTVIYVKNTTEAINKLAYRLGGQLEEAEFVLVSLMEHHSNYLPWLKHFGQGKCENENGQESIDVIRPIDVDEIGRLNLGDLERKLQENKGRIKYVAVTGASNVSGNVNPIYEIARIVHRYGAKIIVDGAQWVPHCPVDMNPQDKECCLDFLVFSAHKMYAPFGCGVIIGPREVFEHGVPEYLGGGSARLVINEAVWLTDVPGRDEAGTPNFIGAITLAEAIKTLELVGMEQAEHWEQVLMKPLLPAIQGIPGVKVYGDPVPSSERLAILTFNIDGLYHDTVAVALAEEYGIAVRNGCFCAQPYVQRLLGIKDEEMRKYSQKTNALRPGMVRASLALYNTEEEVAAFVYAIEQIARSKEHYGEQYGRLMRKVYWR